MDYVTTPNYISLDHPASAGMFESADSKSLLAESTAAHGYSDESVQAVISHYSKMAELEMMVEATERTAELETALLESQGRHLEAMVRSQMLKRESLCWRKQQVSATMCWQRCKTNWITSRFSSPPPKKTHSASKNLVMQKSWYAFRISDQSWRTQLACHQEN